MDVENGLNGRSVACTSGSGKSVTSLPINGVVCNCNTHRLALPSCRKSCGLFPFALSPPVHSTLLQDIVVIVRRLFFVSIEYSV